MVLEDSGTSSVGIKRVGTGLDRDSQEGNGESLQGLERALEGVK